MNKNPIIITGIHRSGTSLLSKIFENNKIFFGSVKDLNNESLFFQNLNKWLLSSYGMSWENPKCIDFEIDENRFNMILFKLENILKSRLNFRYLGVRSLIMKKDLFELDFDWGWKDPRNIFSLPFWLKLFPESKVIILIRHPFDVVNSLIARNKYLLEQDLILKDKISNYFLIPFLNIISLFESFNFSTSSRRIFTSSCKRLMLTPLFIIDSIDFCIHSPNSVSSLRTLLSLSPLFSVQ